MHEHDDDLSSEVREQAEKETAGYPNTGDDVVGRTDEAADEEFEDEGDDEEEDDEVDLDEDKTEL